MVEILRFEYDGTSFEDYEYLQDMKFFSEKNFSFSFAQISREPNRGSLGQNSEFAFHNSKGREVKFQTESFSFSLKKIQGKTDQNQQQQQQQKKKLEFSSEKLTQMRTDYGRKSWN
ncbi:hypothetical protein SO802_004645 [Lithocarpus litseifolius]|uniref:Uncharacterized protein n=1 Tax=Lithocarpus litseifolius TaxID=425828 RepID=A0AAW2E4L4_9ROSI